MTNDIRQSRPRMTPEELNARLRALAIIDPKKLGREDGAIWREACTQAAEIVWSTRSERRNDDGRNICGPIVPDEIADELGVQRFAKAMLAKMEEKRLQGYGGWNNDCTDEHLERLLKKHIDKPWDDRNLVDMANFLMMLWSRRHPDGR